MPVPLLHNELLLLLPDAARHKSERQFRVLGRTDAGRLLHAIKREAAVEDSHGPRGVRILSLLIGIAAGAATSAPLRAWILS